MIYSSKKGDYNIMNTQDSINELSVKVNDLETLITSIQDMVMHNINTVYAVASLILALVAITGFSYIKNTVNNRFDLFYEENNKKLFEKIMVEIEKEDTRLNSLSFHPTTLNGMFHDENNPLTISILDNKTIAIFGTAIFEGSENQQLLSIPRNFKINRTFVFSIIGENMQNGKMNHVFLEFRDNGIFSKSNVSEKTKLHFNTVMNLDDSVEI